MNADGGRPIMAMLLPMEEPPHSRIMCPARPRMPFKNDPILTVEPNWSAFFPGESVTLLCDTRAGKDTDWLYSFSKDGYYISSYNANKRYILLSLITSQSGKYKCHVNCKVSGYYSGESNEVSLTVSGKAVVNVQPNWPEIYQGESITLTCDIVGGEDSEWKYVWTMPNPYTGHTRKEYPIQWTSPSDSGDYRCQGREKSGMSETGWSDAFRLTISKNGPKAVLTVSPSWLSPGDSVTLNCSVTPQSPGWRFYWYKAVPNLSNIYYRSELPTGSKNGTKQNSYIVHGQSNTTGYFCTAVRGNQKHYTLLSQVKFVWSGGTFDKTSPPPMVCLWPFDSAVEPQTLLQSLQIPHGIDDYCYFLIYRHCFSFSLYLGYHKSCI
uniref:Ig-like domain-containing protein n=1 Tax=Mola mola TaxID=94237 RepID=A0A3Q4BDP4_MOLML